MAGSPEMAADFDIVAIGEAMVEFNQTGPEGDRTYLQGFGGDTSNAVIAASRQGARCAFVTRLGNDDFGRMCLDLWGSERVDTASVGIDAAAPTGVYFVRHSPAGHSFSYLRAGSAASRMQAADMPTALLQNTRYLHVSGISQAISASATAAIRHAILTARAAGAKVSYDPNLRLKLWGLERAREVIVETIGLCDVFLPSLDDVQTVSALESPRDIVQWSHRMGAPLVVLKLGKDGALVSDGKEYIAVPAFSVNAVDATGAGDCFDGNLLARLAAGASPVEAARWACAAAALATTGYGAVAPLPDATQVAQFLKNPDATSRSST